MITTVIPVLNHSDLLYEILDTSAFSDLIIIDNGSIPPLSSTKYRIVRNKRNVGNYPIFKQGFELSNGDIIAYIHSDFVIWDIDWESKVEKVFKDHKDLGLLGFIGSTEIDASGGRGLGTISNFQGKELLNNWKGSKAEIHGKRIHGFTYAAVIDGCSMIFRRKALEDIEFRTDFPIHHFYDRLMSCQMREKGWRVGVLGIASDHFSGQTANTESAYMELAERWMKTRYGSIESWAEKYKLWIQSVKNPSMNILPGSADHWLYLEAERMFLQEYRDEKHLIPYKEK